MNLTTVATTDRRRRLVNTQVYPYRTSPPTVSLEEDGPILLVSWKDVIGHAHPSITRLMPWQSPSTSRHPRFKVPTSSLQRPSSNKQASLPTCSTPCRNNTEDGTIITCSGSAGIAGAGFRLQYLACAETLHNLTSPDVDNNHGTPSAVPPTPSAHRASDRVSASPPLGHTTASKPFSIRFTRASCCQDKRRPFSGGVFLIAEGSAGQGSFLSPFYLPFWVASSLMPSSLLPFIIQSFTAL